MKLLLFAALTFCSGLYAQENIPTIRSTSEQVDIRIGNDFYSQGGWHLNPDANPDVFSIGSKWNYTSRKVSFITDIDSISFNVAPGGKYDFIILLNENQPCHIQILTSANPYFMQNKVIIPLMLFLILKGLVIYIFWDRLPYIPLLRLGFICPLFFWITTIMAGIMHGNYIQHINVISELGAIGSRSEVFTSSAFVVLSILCLLFFIGFYITSQKLRLSVIPAMLTFSMPIAFLWAGIFPLKNEFHNLIGPLPLFTMIGALLAFVLWRKNHYLRRLRTLSLVSLIIMLLLFLRFVPPFGYEYEGVVQRFFYIGWSLWYISIATSLPQVLSDHRVTA